MTSGLFSTQWINLTFLFIGGCVVGSFLNVCIFRIPECQSIITPPSRCGSCGKRLRFLDLIPVLSALIFRFKCRYCGHKYSWQYPFIEALTGVLFLGAVLAFGPTLQALVTIVVSCCLLVIFFVDLRYLIIPDGLNVIILVAGLALDTGHLYTILSHQAEPGEKSYTGAVQFVERLVTGEYPVYLPRSILGILVGAGTFLLISWVASKVFGKESMGGGDVKLAGAMGAVLGPGYVFASYALVSIVLGAVVGVLLIGLKIRSRKDYIPFGPMMAVAGIIMLFWGEPVAELIVKLYHIPSAGGG